MAQGETLNDVSISSEWSGKVKGLLDAYLCEFGISSEVSRAFWIDQVIDDLVTRAELVATEDILEEAIEQMRNLIEARVAMVCGYDPVREQKEIAQVIVVLLNENNADCRNKLFERSASGIDAAVLESLQQSLKTYKPIPTPTEAPLAMPVQIIELRPINPLRRLFGRSR